MARAHPGQHQQHRARGEQRVLRLGQRGSLVMRLAPLTLAMALLLGPLVAGCTGGGKDAGGLAAIGPAAGNTEGSVGQNLAGESCRTAPRTGASALPGEPAPLDLLCGTGKEPV